MRGLRRQHKELLDTRGLGTCLDVHGLDIADAPALEAELNQIPGVLTNGLFARRPANVLLLGSAQGVQTILPA